jgi:hypothetical protein
LMSSWRNLGSVSPDPTLDWRVGHLLGQKWTLRGLHIQMGMVCHQTWVSNTWVHDLVQGVEYMLWLLFLHLGASYEILTYNRFWSRWFSSWDTFNGGRQCNSQNGAKRMGE